MSDIGDVYAFGLNSHGQLGIGATTLKHRQQTDDTADSSNTAIPQPVDFYDTGASFTEPLGDVRIVKLACGNAHSAVLDEHGHLYTCGWNKYEQLGHIRHDIPDSVEKDILREQTSSISFFQRIPSDRAWNHIYCGRWTTFVW
ncbi:RCC1 domain-containing protein 1 [Actinomortierella wolfii]|nr:RCC1 domain-containing protein 1 [Actinomortierella wolfii]